MVEFLLVGGQSLRVSIAGLLGIEMLKFLCVLIVEKKTQLSIGAVVVTFASGEL